MKKTKTGKAHKLGLAGTLRNKITPTKRVKPGQKTRGKAERGGGQQKSNRLFRKVAKKKKGRVSKTSGPKAHEQEKKRIDPKRGKDVQVRAR